MIYLCVRSFIAICKKVNALLHQTKNILAIICKTANIPGAFPFFKTHYCLVSFFLSHFTHHWLYSISIFSSRWISAFNSPIKYYFHLSAFSSESTSSSLLRFLMIFRSELKVLYCCLVLKKFLTLPCDRLFSASFNILLQFFRFSF